MPLLGKSRIAHILVNSGASELPQSIWKSDGPVVFMWSILGNEVIQ